MKKLKIRYKISSQPTTLFNRKNLAFDAAVQACRQLGEPQILMTVSGQRCKVVDWEHVSSERMFDVRRGPFMTLIDIADPCTASTESGKNNRTR